MAVDLGDRIRTIPSTPVKGLLLRGATRLWTWFTVPRPPFTAAPAPALAGRAGCLSLGSSFCEGLAPRLPSYTAKLGAQSWIPRGVEVGAERLSRSPPASLFVCPLFRCGDRSSHLAAGARSCRVLSSADFDELLSGVRVAAAGSGGHVRWGAVLPRIGCRCARASGGWWTFSPRPWPQELIWLTPTPCKAIAPQPLYLCPFLTGQGSPPPPSPTLLSPRPLLPWALHLAVRGPRQLQQRSGSLSRPLPFLLACSRCPTQNRTCFRSFPGPSTG